MIELSDEKKAELREAWLKALESGEYQQCRGRLKEENGYCCLGVACDVFDNGGWVEDFYDGFNYKGPSFGEYDCTLPPELSDIFGINADNEHLLINFNDKFGSSFKDIAHYIRKHIYKWEV